MIKDKFLKYYVHCSPDAYYCVLPDEAVVFVPRLNSFWNLNKEAAMVWELSDGKRTLGQICRIISREYGIPVENAAADVPVFVRRLAKKGLLFFKGRKVDG